MLKSPLLSDNEPVHSFAVLRESVELKEGQDDEKWVTCMIDQEKFESHLPHFKCPKNPMHAMCVNCFADYVNFCCDSWAAENTVPIRCQMPECRCLIPEETIRGLIQDSTHSHKNLTRRYSQVQLKVALSNAPPDASEVPITCAFCGLYSEFYVKADPDQQDDIQSVILKAEAEREHALVEIQQLIRKEVELLMGNEEKALLDGEIEQRRLQLQADLETKKQGMIRERFIEIARKYAISSEEEILTSLFFICKNIFCDGAYCLSCKSFLKKSAMSSHVCNNSSLEALYKKVMETLAK
jgi:hypothetical protein